ncbi:MAG: hypothetical protein WBQ89_22300, partial [Candidatus Acidiferrum sp.]
MWKTKNVDKRVLTNTGGLVILEGSLVATLLDREAEQKLFDNRYDVPESVRPHSGSSLGCSDTAEDRMG